MARPRKTGLDYFPLDVDMDTDTTIAYIEARHGAVGFAVVVKLLMRIYREGYFAPWNERESFVFARQVGIDHETVVSVAEDAITEGMFDPDMFDTYGVLTSRGIQSRYINGTARRGQVDIENALLLASREAREARHVHLITDAFRPHKGTSAGVSADDNPERKGEESRVEEKVKTIVGEVVAHLNAKAGTKFRPTTASTVRHISARVNDGYTLDDLKAVVDIKTDEWLGDPKMERFLRPETLFAGKFEGYLNERKGNDGYERGTVGNGFRDGSELLGDGDGGA